jgi:HEAT repeat protein
MNITRKILVITSAFVFILSANADAAVDRKKAKALLNAVAHYEFGASRAELAEFDALLRLSLGNPDESGEWEALCIDQLKSGGTFAGKQFICQRLSRFASPASVPVLSDMLQNPETAHMALYALERIPGSKVDEALLSALATATDQKVGIINTLGRRKAEKAVDVLSEMLTQSKDNVAKASIHALGNIGTAQAAQALIPFIAPGSVAYRPDVFWAYLSCADRFLEQGQTRIALEMYRRLDGPDVPVAVRIASLQGQLDADIEHRYELIQNWIAGGDKAAQTLAIRSLHLLDMEKTIAIAGQWPLFSPAKKVQMLAMCEDLGYPELQNVITPATGDPVDQVRMAALAALATCGDAFTVDLLAEHAANSSGEEQKTARNSLYLLKDPAADQYISDKVAQAPLAIKSELILALGERQIASAVQPLFTLTNDNETRIRRAAIKALGDLAPPERIQEMIEVLKKAQTPAEREEAILAVTRVSNNLPEETRVDPVLSALKNANPENRMALLRVLGRLGNERGLPELRTALQDKDQEIVIAAVRATTDWPNADPIADLYIVAQEGKDNRSRILALRGVIELLEKSDNLSHAETAEWYEKALSLTPETNEKRMILSGLSYVRAPEALDVAMPYLKEKDVKAEAESAVVRIASRIRGDHPEKAKNALKAVVAQTDHDLIKAEAQDVLSQLQ